MHPTRKSIFVSLLAMTKGDIPYVADIAQDTGIFLSKEDFLHHINMGRAKTARCNDTIVGFIIYQTHKKNVEILHIAVARQFQKLGFGSQILERIKKDRLFGERKKIAMKIKERNLPIQLFLRKNQFWATEIIKELEEDRYLMEYSEEITMNQILKSQLKK